MVNSIFFLILISKNQGEFPNHDIGNYTTPLINEKLSSSELDTEIRCMLTYQMWYRKLRKHLYVIISKLAE